MHSMFNHRDKVTMYELDEELQNILINMGMEGNRIITTVLYPDRWEGSGPYLQKVLVPDINTETNGAMGLLTSAIDYETFNIATKANLLIDHQGNGFVIVRSLIALEIPIPIWVAYGTNVFPPAMGQVVEQGSKLYMLHPDQWEPVNRTLYPDVNFNFFQVIDDEDVTYRTNGCICLKTGDLTVDEMYMCGLARMDVWRQEAGKIYVSCIEKPTIEVPVHFIYGAALMPPTTANDPVDQAGRPLNAMLLNGIPWDAFLLVADAQRLINEAIQNSDTIRNAIQEALSNNGQLHDFVVNLINNGLDENNFIYDAVNDLIKLNTDSGYIYNAIEKSKSRSMEINLNHRDWDMSSGTCLYRVDISNLSINDNIIVSLGNTTLEQEQMYAECAIKCTDQLDGYVLFTARAKKPTLDIPVRILIIKSQKSIQEGSK